MDNDLLDVHLRADKISPAGIRALVAAMQRERDAIRGVMQELLDLCAEAKTEVATVEGYETTIDAIDYYLGELDFNIEISQRLDWHDLAHHAA